MRRLKYTLFTLFIASFSVYAQKNAEKELSLIDFETAIMKIVQNTKHSVVGIVSCSGPQKFSKYSGVILNEEGYIITTAGAVEEIGLVCAVLESGKMYPAERVGIDKKTNLAVIKINGKNLKPVVKGNSSQLRLGSFLISIGNPYGLAQSASLGIVSGVDRTVHLKDSVLTGLVQTTATVNPGDAGGLILDSRGRFVGLISSTLAERPMLSGTVIAPQGINFIIPSNTANWVADQIIKNGRVKRGRVGIRVENREGEPGVIVQKIFDNGPAFKSGLKQGDCLLTVDGVAIKNIFHLQNIISHKTENEKIRLQALKKDNNKTITIELTLTAEQ